MANKDNIVLSCDTLSTPVPEIQQNLQMSSLTLTEDNMECIDEKVTHYNNCENSSEHVQSSEYVNYYDNENYVLEQLKTEFPEDLLPQSDCGVDSKMHSKNEELLKFIAKAELNNENIEDGLSLNIKEENDYNEYQFIVKTEGLEEQEGTQCKFSHKSLKNGCNLLQNSNKHVKVEINTPITELHQCQYCGNGFDNYNNMLVHISNDHKQENSKCEICGKQFKSIENLNCHVLAVHKLDEPLESVTENCVNCHVDFQHKFPLNDHSKLSDSTEVDGADVSENNVTRNITTYDYRTTFECRSGKQFPIHLRENNSLMHRHNVQNTNNSKFQCDYCKKFFKSKLNLARHITAVHFVYGKRFACWCGKQFRSPLYLRRHERGIHRRYVKNTNNGKLQCDYCMIFITNKRKLSSHIQRVHYDYGKRFDCWCGKQYRSAIHLRQHRRRRHQPTIPNTNNERIQCETCKSSFATKGSLVRHIKGVHFDYSRKFECWCGKQFRTPLHLRDHQRRRHRPTIPNTNNERFPCETCTKSFATKSSLAKHIKGVHFDYGRKFECWCGKQFRSPRYLRQHETRIHKRNINNAKFQCDS